MILQFSVYVVIGLALLALSADKLVEYAISLAKHLQISPYLIGIIIIGFGTSAPEMLVSAMAALDNVGGLAIGNALGSNIANIGLVLGFAALFAPLYISKKIRKLDLSILFAITFLALFLLLDKNLSTLDGIIMVICLIAFLIWSSLSDLNSKNSSNNSSDKQEKDNSKDTNDDIQIEEDEFDLEGEAEHSLAKSAVLTLISLIVLLGSSKILLEGATGISKALGISDLMIGLTVVAIGTSLPELAASIAAARQKQTGLIIGNILGSNVFNTLGVLGIVGLLSNTSVDSTVLQRDFSVLILLMLTLAVVAYVKNTLTKPTGIILLIAYFSYLGFLIYNALSLS